MARISLRSTRCQRRTCSCGVSRLGDAEHVSCRPAAGSGAARAARGRVGALEQVEDAHGRARRGAARHAAKTQVPRRSTCAPPRAVAGEPHAAAVARRPRCVSGTEEGASRPCRVRPYVPFETPSKSQSATPSAPEVLRLAARRRRHAPQARHRGHSGDTGFAGAPRNVCHPKRCLSRTHRSRTTAAWARRRRRRRRRTWWSVWRSSKAAWRRLLSSTGTRRYAPRSALLFQAIAGCRAARADSRCVCGAGRTSRATPPSARSSTPCAPPRGWTRSPATRASGPRCWASATFTTSWACK